MSRTRTRILIVDDNAMLRETLEMIFSEAGYLVRLAHDGFSALAQIRQEAPDLLLSDLYMPGMSGFELLSVVRCRFPEIRVIAMSGSLSGSAVPPGVVADAFHEKGGRTSVDALLRLVRTLVENPLPPTRQSSAPVWISITHPNPYDVHVTITCPECLGVFPQAVRDSRSATEEIHCQHCSTSVTYSFLQLSPEAELTGLGSALAG